MSFRSAARNRLGNLSNFRSSAPPVQHDDSEDGDDNYDYDSEEEEERLLSRRHGEAEEDPKESNSNDRNINNNEGDNKRKPTDEEIAAEYNDKAAKKQRVSRRPRNISETDLVQPNGLSTIFTTFPHLFRKQNYQTNRRKDMAKFSRQLILAYQQWSNKIVPTTPFEEVAWRIQTMNSKTSVKRFLQTMRDQVRNQHVERIFGLEKAEQMIAQLDMALMEQQEDTNDYDDNNANGLDNHDGTVPEEPDTEPITTTTASPEEQEESAANFPTSTETETLNNNNNHDATSQSTGAAARNTITPTPALRKESRRHVLDDSSDEEELTFEDEEEDAPRRAPPSMRRPVLQESDDEDDNELDKNTTNNDETKTAPAASDIDFESPTNEEAVTVEEEAKEPDEDKDAR